MERMDCVNDDRAAAALRNDVEDSMVLNGVE
jgi:hypothetical protein